MEEQKTVRTSHLFDHIGLTWFHRKIWFLSAMGIFQEGFNLFVVGIALPLIYHQHHPSSLMLGIIGASPIAGTIVGSSFLGGLADKFGRKVFYIIDMALIMVFAILAGTVGYSDINWLIVFMFMIGVGVGADYPICASYVSEFMPSRLRGRMLMSAFSFQAMGMLASALTGLVIIKFSPVDEAWRWMLLSGALPSGIILFLRFFAPESPRWCIAHGKEELAATIISKFCGKTKHEVHEIIMREKRQFKSIEEKELGYVSLFSKKYIRKTILASLPWFMMDIATYGIGIFTPLILVSIMGKELEHANYISKDFLSTEGTAFLDIFLLVGFALNFVLIDRLGRMKLQLFGFAGMALGLVILGLSTLMGSSLFLIYGGFIIYNVLMNMGPNSTTFIVAAELFPTKLRASAHGFSAAFAKSGAVFGIMLLPLLKDAVGTGMLLLLLSGVALLGFVLTFVFREETMGKSFEEMTPVEAYEATESPSDLPHIRHSHASPAVVASRITPP